MATKYNLDTVNQPNLDIQVEVFTYLGFSQSNPKHQLSWANVQMQKSIT
jgi:hypothetical protein